VKSKLYRHVEAWHARRIHFDARQVMNALVAVPNHGGDFADPNLSAVCRVESTARIVAGEDGCKDHRAKDGLEPVIKRAINENGLGGRRLSRAQIGHALAWTSTAVHRESLQPQASASHPSVRA
jgi:hypothetical protein